MIQSEKLKEHARRLRLYNIANRMDSILHHAQEEKPTYPEFLSLVLGTEVEMKERKDYERRLVAARLPENMILTNTTTIFMRHRPPADEGAS